MKFVGEYYAELGYVRTEQHTDTVYVLDLNIDHRILDDTQRYTGEVFSGSQNRYLPLNWIAA